MTTLTSLAFRGIKGGTGSVEAPAGENVLVTGPNMSGKSRYLSALRVLLLGHDPATGGKRNADTGRLAGRSSEILVRAVIEGGTDLERQYRRAGRSWGHACMVDGEAGDVDALVGEDAEQTLHLRSLIEAKPSERAAAVQSLLDAGASRDDRVRWILALTTLRLAEVTIKGRKLATVEDLAEAHAEELGDEGRAVLDFARKSEFGDDLGDGLDVTGKTWRSRARTAQDERRQAQAEMGRLEGELAAAGAADARSVEEIEAEVDRLKAEHAAAVREARLAEERGNAARQVSGQIPALEAAVEAAREHLDAAQADLDECYRLREEAEAVVIPDPPAAPNAEDILDDESLRDVAEEGIAIRVRLEGLEIPDPPSGVALQVAAARAEQLGAAVDRAQESPWREVEEIADQLDDPEREPSPQVTRLRELAARHGEDVDALRAELEEVIQSRDKHEAAYDQAEAARDEILAERAQLTEREREINAAIKAAHAKAEKQAARAHETAMRRWKLETGTARREASAQRERADAIERAFHEAKQAHTEAAGALRAAQERLAGMADADEHSATERADAAKDALDAALPQLEAARTHAGSRGRLRELAGLVSDLDVEAAAWQALAYACGRLQEIELAAQSEGLHGRMRAWLEAAGLDVEPFAVARKGRTEFGWTRAGEEVFVELMAGSEYALFCAALGSAALAIRAPDLRPLAIEGAEMEPATLEMFLLGASFARAEWGVQTWVATWVEPVTLPEGWVRVQCGETAEVGA